LPLSKDRVALYSIARKVFEEATTAALGSDVNAVITFHLKKKFGKDPSEVFVEDPAAFYTALKAIFGAGAENIISLVGTLLMNKYGVTCTTESFVNLMVKGDKSSKDTLGEILSHIPQEAET
jgi:hypothetical protein